MNILITGATGTIGSNAVKYFSDKGFRIRAQVRPHSKQLYKLNGFNIEVCEVDLKDRESLSKTVKDMDYVLHLGAQVPKNFPENMDYYDINVNATLALLEGTRLFNKSLKRFVFASSCTTYQFEGWNDSLITKANKFKNPVGLYRTSKISAEMIVNTYHAEYNISTVILEIPETLCGRELLGERRKKLSPYIVDQLNVLRSTRHIDNQIIINKLEKELSKGKQLVIPLGSNGDSWRHHLGDIRDVVRACKLAISSERAIGKSFIIMSDALDYSIGVPHLSKVSGMKYSKLYLPGGDNYWFDMKESNENLGYYAKYDSKQMLEDAWHHSQGKDIGIIDGNDYKRIER